ncbi:hypothetical protein Tco_1281020 [Tanacetum coccineum]
MRPLPSAIGLLVLLKASTKSDWVRICLRANIPSATSAADVAATWASGTQSADVALPRGLTWDLHADIAASVVLCRWRLDESQDDTWHMRLSEGSVRGAGGQISVQGSGRVQYEVSIPEASRWTGGMI